ncbi:preprotein translocase subunit SecD [Halostella sp. JP-L12]|uniref:preprotein translocase subunit SecD n=1 Tax=Halostella TaxID=1843185 RepID=UPI000EF7E99E|nr:MULTISPECIES: preprotein translocase subunit SecD [Halostella]NHN46929.1 preprotein translocase subunit SecD [Halostella sp. JP-L12]
MSALGAIRENWRVSILVVLLTLSAVALFVPGAVVGQDDGNRSVDNEGPTNLQYGIDLAGGARIRAPVVGMTAEEAQFDDGNRVERQVANELGLDLIDVRASRQSGTVEVFNRSVSESEFESALAAANVSHGEIRDGVTDQTRRDIVETLDRKIGESGLAGGTVTQSTTASGERYIVVTAPNRDREELRTLIQDRGDVRIDATYPSSNGSQGYAQETVLRGEDIDVGSTVQQDQRTGEYYVSVTVENRQAAEEFSSNLTAAGFAENPSSCAYDLDSENNTDPGYCLLTIVDDDIVYAAGVRNNLAQSFQNGDFNEDPSFRMTARSEEEASNLRLNLQAGRLAAPLNYTAAQTSYIEPAFAEQFKINSMITGIIAVIAVSLTVYFRYGNARIAAPMVVTALSEVVILLGFAAAIQYPLDLSVIAGFIAVIGTGVDDLIIIADGVMAEGDVESGRIFQNRFRKAFWVIGAAAATTIVAMSPLAVLSLGDLQGFAIVTILGVLVGVLVTRPAYGDILRALVTRR